MFWCLHGWESTSPSTRRRKLTGGLILFSEALERWRVWDMITRQRHDKIVASVKREAQEKGWLSPPPGSITGLYVIFTFSFPFVWLNWIDWFHYSSEGQKRVALLLFSTRSKGKEVRRHLFLNRIGTAFLPSPVFSTSSITATASYLGDRIPRLSYLNESPYLVAPTSTLCPTDCARTAGAQTIKKCRVQEKRILG